MRALGKNARARHSMDVTGGTWRACGARAGRGAGRRAGLRSRLRSRLFAWSLLGGAVAALACGGGEPGGGDGEEDGADAGTGQGADGGSDDGGGANPLDVVVDVPATGPYGTRTFAVPAGTDWVNTGVYLEMGQSATISATGTWKHDVISTGPEGNDYPNAPGDCPHQSLVARTGLVWEGVRLCVGAGATVTASSAGVLYLGSNVSSDLGEIYQDRLRSSGAIEVTVTSEAATVPSVAATELETYPLDSVQSGWVELLGEHVILTMPAAAVVTDMSTATDSIATLDAIYDAHAELRGAVPHGGQRIRFVADPVIGGKGWYMLAGNPVRAVPEIISGGYPEQRILRSSVAETDIWGFAHELGHDFTFVNGTFTYMIGNFLEAWPNIFTLHALEVIGRSAGQPNADQYCQGEASYLAAPSYATLKDDVMLELCFFQQFTEAHGWAIWKQFFGALNSLHNQDIPPVDGDPRPLWGWIRDRFNDAAGVDTTPTFQAWAVPLP